MPESIVYGLKFKHHFLIRDKIYDTKHDPEDN